MSQKAGASKSKPQTSKHPLIDYTVHCKGAALMQEKAYLSPYPLSPFFILFSKAILPCPFILRSWLLEAGRMLGERRERLGKKRISQGLGSCQHDWKPPTIIILIKSISCNGKKLVLAQGCESESKILPLLKSIEKNSIDFGEDRMPT